MKSSTRIGMILAGSLLIAGVSFAGPSPTIQGDKTNINNSCKEEASKASCGNEQVGTGLLKCIHAYKKAQGKNFVVSPGCKSAMLQLKADKTANK